MASEIYSSRLLQQGIPLESLTEKACNQLFTDALTQANTLLQENNIQVILLQHVPKDPIPVGIDPKRNILLGVLQEGKEEPIDIIDMKALDEKSVKPVDLLAQEIVEKAKQHVLAKKVEKIYISTSGSKFDARKLVSHRAEIDREGYLKINTHRVGIDTPSGLRVLKAENLRSYTILRLIEVQERIWIIDDYDFERENKVGMAIDANQAHAFGIERIHELSRPDAERYAGQYVLLSRPELTEEIKQLLLLDFPFSSIP